MKFHTSPTLSLLLLLLFFFFSPSSPPFPLFAHAQTQSRDCNSTLPGYSPSIDYFPHKINSTQGLFTVQYGPSWVRVLNIVTQDEFVLRWCGTPYSALPNTSVADTQTLLNSNAHPVKVIDIPLASVAVEDTAVMRFMEVLGVSESVVRYAAPWTESPCLQDRLNRSLVASFESVVGNASVRAFQIKDVDVVFSDQLVFSSTSNFVTVSAMRGMAPLQRAKWIMFVGLFFNKTVEAESFYSGVERRYECHRKHAMELRIFLRKNLLFTAYLPPNVFSTDKGTYVIHNEAFKVNLIKDASGVLPSVLNQTIADTVGFTDLDLFKEAIANSDFLIDESPTMPSWDYFVELLKVRWSGFEYYGKDAVFRTDKRVDHRGVGEFYYRTIAEPDVALEEIMSILAPYWQPSYKRTWLRKIKTELPELIAFNATTVFCNKPLTPTDNGGDKCRQ